MYALVLNITLGLFVSGRLFHVTDIRRNYFCIIFDFCSREIQWSEQLICHRSGIDITKFGEEVDAEYFKNSPFAPGFFFGKFFTLEKNLHFIDVFQLINSI